MSESQADTILIVDDDPDVVFAVTAMLESSGFQVIAANTGLEALEKVRLDKPDLILLDLMIEGHDTGFQVAKALKGDPATRHIPIIMVSAVQQRTGFGFQQDRDGHWMKTDAFMEKPYEPKTVLAKIKELLSSTPAER
ncbi:MAG: response regulator [Candidatus Lernaella stagnicola]|nr:response regulator [Candidatus Lernaella stagnicola]